MTTEIEELAKTAVLVRDRRIINGREVEVLAATYPGIRDLSEIHEILDQAFERFEKENT